MTNKQVSEHYNTFYSDGFKIGMEVFENGLTDESLKISIQKIYQNMDGLIDSLLEFARKNDTKVFCRKGCSCCCWQPVFALTHEIVFLNEHIRKNFSKEEIDGVLSRSKEKEKKLRGLNREDLLNSKHPCPLLKYGACTVYEARPMACRIYLSLDLNSCEVFYENPKNPKGFPKLMEFPLHAGRMMNEGYKAALKQVGWVSQEYRLEQGLLPDLPGYPGHNI
jgi:Fe-S-cluster containining protein